MGAIVMTAIIQEYEGCTSPILMERRRAIGAALPYKLTEKVIIRGQDGQRKEAHSRRSRWRRARRDRA